MNAAYVTDKHYMMHRNNSSPDRTIKLGSIQGGSKMTTATKTATRLNVNIPESARAEVEQLAEISGRTITDLVRFGLSLVKVVLYESRLGNKLVVTTPDGKALKELVIPGL